MHVSDNTIHIFLLHRLRLKWKHVTRVVTSLVGSTLKAAICQYLCWRYVCTFYYLACHNNIPEKGQVKLRIRQRELGLIYKCSSTMITFQPLRTPTGISTIFGTKSKWPALII